MLILRSGERINRVVVADANVLLSAISRKAASKVFQENLNLEVYTTVFTWDEVRKYIPKFSKLYGISEEHLEYYLDVLPVILVDKPDYLHRLDEAESLIDDPYDVELGALALKLNSPVWSNDNHFKNFPTGRYTTAELLDALDLN